MAKRYNGIRVGPYIGEGNTRIVFEHWRELGWVMKIPKAGILVDYNKQEYYGYMDSVISGKEQSVAKCFYEIETKILYMEKIDPVKINGKTSEIYGLNKDGELFISCF